MVSQNDNEQFHVEIIIKYG